MTKFGFCGPAYESQSLNADAQALINWYYEPDETGKGNSEGFLYPSPGEKVFVNLNPAPIAVPLTFDKDGGRTGASSPAFIGVTPSAAGEIVFGLAVINSVDGATPDPGAGWTRMALAGTDTHFVGFFTQPLPGAGFVSFTCPAGATTGFAAAVKFFSSIPSNKSASLVQGKSIASGTLTGSPLNTVASFDVNVAAGNTIFVVLSFSNAGATNFGVVSVSDTQGNTYAVTNVQNGTSGAGLIWWHATNVAGGPNTVTVVTNSGAIPGCVMDILEIKAS